jgi:hypothetical protein
LFLIALHLELSQAEPFVGHAIVSLYFKVPLGDRAARKNDKIVNGRRPMTDQMFLVNPDSSKSKQTRVSFDVVRIFFAISIFLSLIFGLTNVSQALPSYARQTGQPCGTCHTDFPGLTPYGRKFKLLGYTVGGGPYRTTLFSLPQVKEFKGDPLDAYASGNATQATRTKSSLDANSTATGQSNTWVPPIAMMAIVGGTHTQTSQVPPCGGPYPCNNTLIVSPVSFFYGGAITEHIGAFAQVTYNGAPYGSPAATCVSNQSAVASDGVTPAPTACDPYNTFQWSWDNTDIRYANSANIAGMNVIYGITGNNNPTVQDPWNSTPAWKFPYATSLSGPKPATATLIDGGLGPGHVFGIGGYAFINDLLYLELTGYRSVSFDAQKKLGIDPYAQGMISGVAPYWRVAIEPHWGNHWFMFGTYGILAKLQQWDTTQFDPNTSWQIPAFLPMTDRFLDTAVDAQYQYQGSNYWFTVRGTYIHEYQKLDATFNAGNSSNPSNTLNTFRGEASLAYGNDNRVVLTAQYFNTKGSTDAGLYSGLVSQFDPTQTAQANPDSNGYVFEIAYIPFISSQAPAWPWANMRVGLQYTYYNKFDGDSTYAHDNNTLFAYIWFAM